MKIIFAQGNPGSEYAASRHNVGWQIIDAFAEQRELAFANKPKFFASIAEYTIHDEKILLVKPTTFYNQTGQSAGALIDFYKLTPQTDVLVIHDDLALPFGTLRARSSGTDAGNNGIKSLNAHIGPDYARLRIGIYNELRDRIPDADFVLSKFTTSEQSSLETHLAPKCLELIEDFISETHQSTSYSLGNIDEKAS